MHKRVVILFSGGLDSTYLVWKNLKDGNTVFPVYINICNNGEKSILEKNRVELLYHEFNNEFGDLIHSIKHGMDVSIISTNSDALVFKQVPIWLLGVLYSQYNADEIQIGYVMNDDVVSYITDIGNIYKSYSVIMDKMLPLKFPLLKKSKYEMVDELPNNYLNLIVSCENPIIIGSRTAKHLQYEPCCDCGSCRRIIYSDYYGTHKFPSNYNIKMNRNMELNMIMKGYKLISPDGVEIKSCETECKIPIQLEIPFPDLSSWIGICGLCNNESLKYDSINYDKNNS